MIDGRICRAARGYLNWTSRTLSSKSGVQMQYIFHLERDRPIPEAFSRAIEAAFRQAGVEMVSDGTRAIGIHEIVGPSGRTRAKKAQPQPTARETPSLADTHHAD